MNGQYVVFFIPESGMYAHYDRFDRPPMRRIQPEEIKCNCNFLEDALMIVEALNEQGFI